MSHPPIESQITFIYTNDLAETARFYEDVMGLRLKLDQGACRIYQVGRDSHFGFCQRSGNTSPDQEQSHVILTIVTHRVDEWHQHLTEHGVRLEKSPAVNSEYGIYHFFLRDPDGNLLEVQQFLDPF